VAQRYVLNYPNVACVIPGFRNERQVTCNLAAIDRSLSSQDMIFIEEVLQ
jgi:aryl-alcohol dehydrogenase-like predicted oxidoreductase